MPGDTWKGRGTGRFGGQEEESSEMRGGPQEENRREGRKKASAIPPFEKVANPKKADVGFLTPAGNVPAWSAGRLRSSSCHSRPPT